MPGGQPSTTQPSAGPWLSPQVVTRNRWPNVLCDMAGLVTGFGTRRPTEGAPNLGLAQRPGEEAEGRLQGRLVGAILGDAKAAAKVQAAPGRGGAGGDEVVGAAAGQPLELGARDGARGEPAVAVGRDHAVGVAEQDGDRRAQPREA